MTDFWRNLHGADLELNLHGDPPYDVRAAAGHIVGQFGWLDVGPVLEIGAGLGRLLAEMDLSGFDVVGIDVNPECVRETNGKVQFCSGDGRIPWVADYFTAAYSVTVFQHLPEDVQRRYLVELARVVKPGGRIVIQHVCGDERGPQSRQVAGMEWLDWCDEAGLLLLGSASDPFQPDWTWFTMEIPA